MLLKILVCWWYLHTLKVSALPGARYCHIGLLLLIDLPLVHRLLKCSSCHQPVHCYVTPLTNTERSVLCLQVMSRVPTGIKNDLGGYGNIVYVSVTDPVSVVDQCQL